MEAKIWRILFLFSVDLLEVFKELLKVHFSEMTSMKLLKEEEMEQINLLSREDQKS